MEEYTTIRLTKKVKEALDKITSRDMSYSTRLSILLQESNNNNLIDTYVDAVKSTADYISLDEFEKSIEEM